MASGASSSGGRSRKSHPGERRDRPRDQEEHERTPDERPSSKDRRGSVGTELDGGGRGEGRREEQTDRRRDHEAGVRMVEQDLRRRERVQREEPGARDQRERDQEQTRVRSPTCRLARDEGERDVDQRDDQHEEEVRWMMFPLHVDARDGEEQDQPGERQRQQHAEEPELAGGPARFLRRSERGLRARCGSRGRTSSRAHDRPRIVGYVSRAPPGDPRRAIERTWPADRLASRLRIEWIAEHTEARWHEVAATSCWEAPSAGSDPSCARRRGGVAPRWAARRCSRRTTVRRRASCTRPRRAGHRSRAPEGERPRAKGIGSTRG